MEERHLLRPQEVRELRRVAPQQRVGQVHGLAQEQQAEIFDEGVGGEVGVEAAGPRLTAGVAVDGAAQPAGQVDQPPVFGH